MISIFASEKDDFKILLQKSKIVNEECFAEGNIIEATLDGTKVLFVSTGYNKINLGLVAGYVIGKYKIDALIGLGNCGYLENCQLKIGDIAIAHSAVQYSVDSTAIGYPDTVIPGVGLGVFPCFEKLVTLAEKACRELNYCYLTGKVATSETFVADNFERSMLASKYTSQFIDMECGGAGQIAYIYNIPCVFIKGVSNFADNCSPSDYEHYSSYANAKANEVVYYMLKCLNDKENISFSVNLTNFRELSEYDIRAVIESSSYVNLGVSENNQPYVVPMSFEVDSCNSNVINLYSKDTGKKMTGMENNDRIVLEFMVYTSHGYKSVIAFGRAKITDVTATKMCNTNLVKIMVTIDTLSGREYYKCK